MEIAMKSDGISFIGHAIDAKDVEEDYEDKSMPTQMRAVAAHIYGRETRFDDPQFANADAAMLGMILTRQGIECLPRKPGRERKDAYDLNDPENAVETQTFDHYMDDFNSVLHRVSLDQYLKLLREHRFNSIKDIGY